MSEIDCLDCVPYGNAKGVRLCAVHSQVDSLRKELAQVKASCPYGELQAKAEARAEKAEMDRDRWKSLSVTAVAAENPGVLEYLKQMESEVAALKEQISENANAYNDGVKFSREMAEAAESELSALKEREGKIVETRDHYEKELADAKARRDKRVYELTEVAYLASLRPHLAVLPPLQAKGEECQDCTGPGHPVCHEHPPAPEKPSGECK